MENLIKALQILLTYGNPSRPTHCEHDVLIICGINPDDVADHHIKELEELGFFTSREYGDRAFISFKFGSA